MSQPNAASKPNVYCDGSLNRTVAPPDESNEPAWLPQGLARIDVAPNPWHAAVCAALAFCLPNRSTAQLLSMPNDLLLNVATHLHLEPRSLVAFLTCCNVLWAPGRLLLFKARVEHQLALIGGNGLEAGASSCPMPCYHIEPNLDPEDPVLRHMARGVAIAIGSLMSHVEHQAHGQPYPSVLSERRCARGGFGYMRPLLSPHNPVCRSLRHAALHACKAFSQPSLMLRVPLCRHGAPMSSFDWTNDASGLPRLAAVRSPLAQTATLALLLPKPLMST